ncbi:MAG: OadG family protein [Spirochaetaceae bacterium]|jgi:oxaloacetate decarboxylase gamma subunit|nr:OadG family protein [Spirochaetaceae bacterium]
MTIAQMFNQSGVLALLGMTVVFSFLVIMIVVISMAGNFIHAAGLDRDLSAKTAPAGNAVQTGPDGAIVAAITGALKAHLKV